MNDRELEKIFKALANRRRLAILKHLKRHGASSVGDVADAIHLSLTATSKHLIILANVNLLEKEQESVVVYYHIAKGAPRAIRLLNSLL
jgi:ArsR family transcriptional regulator, arsenate/arsenite/antimonite-responsive transcriptional repressor